MKKGRSQIAGNGASGGFIHASLLGWHVPDAGRVFMSRLFLSWFLIIACLQVQGQEQGQSSSSIPGAVAQFRKSVVFIELKCDKGRQTLDVRATGFFVQYPDTRIPAGSFSYLVTNRHAAMCWDDGRVPMKVASVSVKFNLRDGSSRVEALSQHGNASWFLPADESVDLAVLPLLLDPKLVDYLTCPLSYFVTKEGLRSGNVSAGARILFSGFFYQFPGKNRIQPIVRQGILAMNPDEQLVNTTDRPGDVYLGDVHIFGGNSGSPVLIDVNSNRDNFMGFPSYRFLGVISGLFYEDQNFNLKAATTFKGTMHANSGIALIVPADALKSLLDDPRVQGQRDADVKRILGR